MRPGDFTGSLHVREKPGQESIYSPNLARFLQPDSIVPGAGNPQNLNRYAYVLNSPVNFSDPTGHFCEGGYVLDGMCIDESTTQGRIDSYVNHDTPDWNTCDKYPMTPGCITEPEAPGGDPKDRGAEEDLKTSSSPAFDPDRNLSDVPLTTCIVGLFSCESLAWLSDLAGGVSTFFQDLSTTLSGLGAAVELGFTGLGCTYGPEGCAVGFGAGNAVYQAMLNPWEGIAGMASTGATIIADLASGETNAQFSPQSGYVISIGGGTITSLSTQGLGSLSNVAVVDVLLDGYGSAYSHNLAPAVNLAPVSIGNLHFSVVQNKAVLAISPLGH
ncbi:MAG: hypothetical protein HYZ26_06435 [Chloroflexi bacterium]|nr:hypothetical protein [Chloroflexota bacterium]